MASTVLKLIVWHTVCGGLVIMILRLVMALLSIIFLAPSFARVHLTFVEYTLNPIGKRIVQTKRKCQFPQSAVFCYLIQIPLNCIAIPIVSFVFFGISMYLTAATMSKYHTFMWQDPTMFFNAGMEIEIMDDNDVKVDNINNNEDNTEQLHKEINNEVSNQNRSNNGIIEGEPDIDDEDEVATWLKSIGDEYYDKYYPLFMQNGFDKLKLIETLTDNDLRNELGITKLGHRRNLQMAIQRLSNENNNMTQYF